MRYLLLLKTPSNGGWSYFSIAFSLHFSQVIGQFRSPTAQCVSLFLLVLIHLQQNFAQSLQNDVITLVRNFNRPSVMFSQSQISKNSQSKYCHCQTFYKLIPLSLFSSVVVILNTRLAVILKFLYLCCYSVLITKQFN